MELLFHFRESSGSREEDTARRAGEMRDRQRMSEEASASLRLPGAVELFTLALGSPSARCPKLLPPVGGMGEGVAAWYEGVNSRPSLQSESRGKRF